MKTAKRYEVYNVRPRGYPPIKYHVFNLRDYLKPNGKYPHSQLRRDLWREMRAGNRVWLRNVAGHIMLAGYPEHMKENDEHGNGECWLYNNQWYRHIPKHCI